MKPFDIFIAYTSWGNEGKFRPVLVYTQNDNRVDAFSITTKYEIKSKAIQEKYFKINDWKQSGLVKQSYIDTNNKLNLPAIVFDAKNPIGQLTESDKSRFLDFLNIVEE